MYEIIMNFDGIGFYFFLTTLLVQNLLFLDIGKKNYSYMHIKLPKYFQFKAIVKINDVQTTN